MGQFPRESRLRQTGATETINQADVVVVAFPRLIRGERGVGVGGTRYICNSTYIPIDHLTREETLTQLPVVSPPRS